MESLRLEAAYGEEAGSLPKARTHPDQVHRFALELTFLPVSGRAGILGFAALGSGARLIIGSNIPFGRPRGLSLGLGFLRGLVPLLPLRPPVIPLTGFPGGLLCLGGHRGPFWLRFRDSSPLGRPRNEVRYLFGQSPDWSLPGQSPGELLHHQGDGRGRSIQGGAAQTPEELTHREGGNLAHPGGVPVP